MVGIQEWYFSQRIAWAGVASFKVKMHKFYDTVVAIE